ncbi:hypothetical protein A4A36_07365 [Bacillus subtilis]|uniref:hypothetical protein n=1 Tax=Bacillus stercoris TaxID=2054641 RepID=UPI0008FB2A1B|nr:hypothetical protein A4A35_16320 [Bacillus subtilis]OIS62672.1 hypothetical protein A4A36_07365 [Bacillus subtilis]OIS68765.1 hypothetical protein A4A37_01685 [Bacillus subtilis]
MNGKVQAEEKIVEFLNSEERMAIVTGTHMFEKHKLVLNTLEDSLEGANILFRSSVMDNVSYFLQSTKALKTGTPYRTLNNTVFVDTVNKRTWDKHDSLIHVAVVYPLKSIENEKLREDLIRNLIETYNVSKLIFVSSQDTLDLSWTNPIKTKIVYDSLEDDPEYHQRVLDNMEKFGFPRT